MTTYSNSLKAFIQLLSVLTLALVVVACGSDSDDSKKKLTGKDAALMESSVSDFLVESYAETVATAVATCGLKQDGSFEGCADDPRITELRGKYADKVEVYEVEADASSFRVNVVGGGHRFLIENANGDVTFTCEGENDYCVDGEWVDADPTADRFRGSIN